MNNQAKSKYLASFAVRQALGSKNPLSRLFFNLVAFCIVLGFFVLMVWGGGEITEPMYIINQEPITLDPKNLIPYSLQTLIRMLLAASVSLVFAIIYALLAAKNEYAEQILIPLLDILQSVPILGYISFTVAGFLALFPGNIFGAELAAIFAIFTSQVWNMIFSFYQSLKTVPGELTEAARMMRLSSWQRFWKVELPFGVPGLVWNTAVSVSSGWFFVVAAEAITVGNNTLKLQGIGSYIALAIADKDLTAILYAVIAMIVVILLYNQLLMQPIVAWSDKFRYEMSSSSSLPRSWVLNVFHRSNLIHGLFSPLRYLARFIVNFPALMRDDTKKDIIAGAPKKPNRVLIAIWYLLLLLLLLAGAFQIFNFIQHKLGLDEVIEVFKLTTITLVRVFVLIIIASFIWVPIGIFVGLRPKLSRFVQPVAQFLSSFPANLLFPVVVILITRYDLNPNIWLSPLMIMSTQWYILFNVIAGAASMPTELKETVQIFKIKGWLWWSRVTIPVIMPYFLTGAITASGGAWNASIVAEIVSFGDTTLVVDGIGSYIARMTTKGDFQRIVLGIGMMAFFIMVINKCFWQPIHNYVNNKFQL